MRLAAVLLVVLVLGMLAEVLPLVPAPTPEPPNYTLSSSWLCRPGRDDVCARPTTATVFAPDGGKHTVTFAADPDAPIDCFYVYPTVSHARSDNAPIAATGDEIGAVQKQFARFAAVCRPYAPLYRQVTRDGLGKIIDDPDPNVLPRAVAFADVTAAWTHYVAHDNAGRGVVLIGHSQGAKLLARLIAEKIDGKPEQAELVSAILPGTKVDVPAGQAVGGSFAHVPLCASASQIGCVIAYSSYPADKPVPADAVFGRTRQPGMVYACVDPAVVAGTVTLDADLPLFGELRRTYGTDFAELPGLLTATCRRDGTFSILAVTAKRVDAAGEKASALIERLAEYSPAWGLHGLDIALAEGTLVDIVRREAAAYAHR